MAMNILFIVALSIIHAPLALTDAGNMPSVICIFGGSLVQSTYKFSESDIPDRCEAVSYSAYLVDSPPSQDDINAIKSLVSKNKLVYTLITGMKSPWEDLMNNNKSTAIAPMAKFITDNHLSGIILSMLKQFDGKIDDYANKLKAFISNIKSLVQKEIPNFVVAMDVMGDDVLSFTNKKVFDFPTVNKDVAFIVVDASNVGSMCFDDTAISGRLPVKPTKDSSVISVDQICTGIAGSSMDQSKVILSLLVQVIMANGTTAADGQFAKSYSEYCQKPVDDASCWCADSAKIIYGIVNGAKKCFKGMGLFPMDMDDTDESCKCGKFPVANTFIDAWQSKPMTGCPQIGFQGTANNTNSTQP